MKRKYPISLMATWFAFLFGLPASAADSRIITGKVFNEATGTFLTGAQVEVEGTRQRVLTDEEGRYAINLPSASATLRVSYTGLQPKTVHVESGTSIYDVPLTSDIYQMAELVIEGEREGSAMAITRQRNAPNIKNVVATDAFGTMTDDNVGLFLERITGINTATDSGTVRSVMVRGIAADLNTVSMDGIQMANSDTTGTNRQFDFLQASITALESIEVTKAPTPDMPANSIGGNINLVTRSIFTRTNPRSFSYSIGFVHNIGPLGDVRPRIESSRRWYGEPVRGFTPTVSANYTDVFGKNKNLGVSLSYSSNIRFLSTYGNSPVYRLLPIGEAAPIDRNALWVNPAGADTRQNMTAKIEYKLSEQTLISLTLSHTDNYLVSDSRTQTLGTVAASVAPGSGPYFTEALPSNSTTASISQQSFQRQDDNYRFGAAMVHNLDGLKIDYTATLSKSDAITVRASDPNARKGVSGKPLANVALGAVRNIGWTIDRQQNEDWPRMIQTSGPDIYDLASYPTLTATQDNSGGKARILHGNLNLRKDLNLQFPAYVKTGLQYQEERRSRFANNFRHSFTPPGGAEGNLGQFLDRDSWTNIDLYGQPQPPWIDDDKVAQSIDNEPELWTRDYAYENLTRLQANLSFKETIGAAYAMTGMQIRNLGILAGIRMEETKTEGHGPVNKSTLSAEETARRNAWVGPVTDAEALRRAQYQAGERVQAGGKYNNVFPGAHLKYTTRFGLIARASYTTSIGRPRLTSIIPNTTVNDTSRVLTIANPSLKPQEAENYDVSLEYYFEPIGLFSVGVFRKNVENFIFTDTSQRVGTGSGNGYDGNFEDYQITTSANGGSAKYEGLELSYQQQFTFLPGFWSGFGVNASFTRLQTEGNYGGTIGTSKVAGFRPKTANLAVNYRKGKFDIRLQGNWVDRFQRNVNNNPAAVSWEIPHYRTSAKFAYSVTPRTTFYVNWDNVLGESIDETYRGSEDRMNRYREFPPTIAFGVHGRF
jgi:TonB-dependent receptor